MSQLNSHQSLSARSFSKPSVFFKRMLLLTCVLIVPLLLLVLVSGFDHIASATEVLITEEAKLLTDDGEAHVFLVLR
jgi:hypothetical protein